MTRENLVVRPEEMEVVDGKVVISSEELVAAIQDYEFDPNADEEAEAITFIGLGCKVKG